MQLAALTRVLDIRNEQISKGFTAASEAQGPTGHLQGKAEQRLYWARLARTRGKDEPLDELARHYATVGALMLAAVERILFLQQANEEREDAA